MNFKIKMFQVIKVELLLLFVLSRLVVNLIKNIMVFFVR